MTDSDSRVSQVPPIDWPSPWENLLIAIIVMIAILVLPFARAYIRLKEAVLR